MVDRVDESREVPRRDEAIFVLHRFLNEIVPIQAKEKIDLSKVILRENFFSKVQSPLKKNIEQKILLNRINPLILERPDVNERLDIFIRDRIGGRIPQEANRPLLLDNLPVPDQDSKKTFFSSTGLRASVSTGYTRTLTVNGEKVALEDYNDIHFTPERRHFFSPSKMTESLASGIQGVVGLIDAIDQGKFQAAPVFVGTTNINMALIAQRLGFVITDECRTPDGNINKNLRSFTVVGKLEDIRTRVEEFRRAGVAQKLEQRSQRLQAKPKLVPAGT